MSSVPPPLPTQQAPKKRRSRGMIAALIALGLIAGAAGIAGMVGFFVVKRAYTLGMQAGSERGAE